MYENLFSKELPISHILYIIYFKLIKIIYLCIHLKHFQSLCSGLNSIEFARNSEVPITVLNFDWKILGSAFLPRAIDQITVVQI